MNKSLSKRELRHLALLNSLMHNVPAEQPYLPHVETILKSGQNSLPCTNPSSPINNNTKNVQSLQSRTTPNSPHNNNSHKSSFDFIQTVKPVQQVQVQTKIQEQQIKPTNKQVEPIIKIDPPVNKSNEQRPSKSNDQRANKPNEPIAKTSNEPNKPTHNRSNDQRATEPIAKKSNELVGSSKTVNKLDQVQWLKQDVSFTAKGTSGYSYILPSAQFNLSDRKSLYFLTVTLSIQFQNHILYECVYRSVIQKDQESCTMQNNKSRLIVQLSNNSVIPSIELFKPYPHCTVEKFLVRQVRLVVQSHSHTH